MTAAKNLFEEVICKFGAAAELWSDGGKAFVGEAVKDLTDLFATKAEIIPKPMGDLVRVYDPAAENSAPVILRNQWVGRNRVAGRKGMLNEQSSRHCVQFEVHEIRLCAPGLTTLIIH